MNFLAEVTEEVTLNLQTVVTWALSVIGSLVVVIGLLWRKSERLERIIYKLTTAVREDGDGAP